MKSTRIYWASQDAGRQVAAIAIITFALLVLHWFTPIAPYIWHALHVVFRNLLFIPVFLAAMWFGMHGVLVVLTGITFAYMPHIVLQWSGDVGENLNQYGQLFSLWTVGIAAGWLAAQELKAKQATHEMQEGALAALVSALDAREHGTGEHSLRVRDSALAIGRELGLSRSPLQMLGKAALLHDIGKIGIPDEILLKSGRLTEAEWVRMKTHSALGHRILEPIPALREVAAIVLAHHERFDGTGYPTGLAGDEIPLGARIFAVADVFDALTSDRPYHRAMSTQEAIAAIREESGKHFDPDVVRAFGAVHDAGSTVGG